MSIGYDEQNPDGNCRTKIGALSLFMGDAEDKENLMKHGITHILSVHNNAKPLLEVSIANPL
uniref:Uncharacterized protein n=1 Tax=Pseudonaja textilis TaxID=8673 RepID=A0A670YAV3_PSETE